MILFFPDRELFELLHEPVTEEVAKKEGGAMLLEQLAVRVSRVATDKFEEMRHNSFWPTCLFNFFAWLFNLEDRIAEMSKGITQALQNGQGEKGNEDALYAGAIKARKFLSERAKQNRKQLQGLDNDPIRKAVNALSKQEHCSYETVAQDPQLKRLLTTQENFEQIKAVRKDYTNRQLILAAIRLRCCQIQGRWDGVSINAATQILEAAATFLGLTDVDFQSATIEEQNKKIEQLLKRLPFSVEQLHTFCTEAEDRKVSIEYAFLTFFKMHKENPGALKKQSVWKLLVIVAHQAYQDAIRQARAGFPVDQVKAAQKLWEALDDMGKFRADRNRDLAMTLNGRVPGENLRGGAVYGEMQRLYPGQDDRSRLILFLTSPQADTDTIRPFSDYCLSRVHTMVSPRLELQSKDIRITDNVEDPIVIIYKMRLVEKGYAGEKADEDITDQESREVVVTCTYAKSEQGTWSCSQTKYEIGEPLA